MNFSSSGLALAPFWPLLFSDHSYFKSLVTHVLNFSNPEGILIQGRNETSVYLVHLILIMEFCAYDYRELYNLIPHDGSLTQKSHKPLGLDCMPHG